MNRLDKLFKDKLVDHPLTPPPNAWARIEVGLSKKNSGFLRIAATVILVSALAGTLIWLTTRNLSGSDERAESVPIKKQEPLKEKGQNKSDNRTIASFPATHSKEKSVPFKKEQKIADPIDVKPPVILAQAPVLDEAPSVTTTESPALPEVENKTVAIQEKAEKPIVIEYRLETIVTQPTADESQLVASAREKSGFRKVLDFAIDAKNSSPLGNLREAKDELLAFNKKEKQNAK